MTQPAPAGDKVTLWGVLGIVLSFCCGPIGLVFDVLCLQEAKRVGKPPTLAYIGFVLAALNILGWILNFAMGGIWAMNS